MNGILCKKNKYVEDYCNDHSIYKKYFFISHQRLNEKNIKNILINSMYQTGNIGSILLVYQFHNKEWHQILNDRGERATLSLEPRITNGFHDMRDTYSRGYMQFDGKMYQNLTVYPDDYGPLQLSKIPIYDPAQPNK